MILNKTILIVGDFVYPIYEKAFYLKFKELGLDTYKFEINPYFHQDGVSRIKKLYGKFQYKYNFGSSVSHLNDDLISKVKVIRPDIVLFYRGRHIFPSTLKKLKVVNPQGKLFNYNNDDPFSSFYPKYYWKLFRKGLSYYDHLFCYREKNIKDLAGLDINCSSLLMPYYIKEENFQFNECFRTREYDIVFIGHFEKDGRDFYIKRLYEEGLKVRLFGTNWESSPYYDYFKQINGDIHRLNLMEYNNVLNKAKVSLVFMSKKNHDEYTRRCFEIPATGAVMLSEFTESLSSLFEADKEIVFFRNADELVEKAKWLIGDPDYCSVISKNARLRLLKDGHELTDRIKLILEIEKR